MEIYVSYDGKYELKLILKNAILKRLARLLIWNHLDINLTIVEKSLNIDQMKLVNNKFFATTIVNNE